MKILKKITEIPTRVIKIIRLIIKIITFILKAYEESELRERKKSDKRLQRKDRDEPI